jgi:hypothetical protein
VLWHKLGITFFGKFIWWIVGHRRSCALSEENAMRRICAWCGTDLGAGNASKDPEMKRPAVEPLAGDAGTGQPAHAPEPPSTICRSCADDLAAYRKPVLVVSQDWARMYDQLVELMRGQPEIQVILDRRQPAKAEEGTRGWNGPDRRRGGRSLVVK